MAGTNPLQEATTISAALRNQIAITDAQFDRVFPASHRFRSFCHWTPVDVALRACALLVQGAGQRVLDVGSGVGKLCLVGALTTPAAWVGVEVEGPMVRAASRAARKLGVVERARFVHGDANAIDWSAFDAIYLFNPFAEELFKGSDGPQARHERYILNIERAQARLRSTRPGTRVVTYHGFGADLPDGFELVHDEPIGHDRLSLWLRT